MASFNRCNWNSVLNVVLNTPREYSIVFDRELSDTGMRFPRVRIPRRSLVLAVVHRELNRPAPLPGLECPRGSPFSLARGSIAHPSRGAPVLTGCFARGSRRLAGRFAPRSPIRGAPVGRAARVAPRAARTREPGRGFEPEEDGRSRGSRCVFQGSNPLDALRPRCRSDSRAREGI